MSRRRRLITTGALSAAGALHHELVKPFGETEIEGQGLLSRPTWHWGAR